MAVAAVPRRSRKWLTMPRARTLRRAGRRLLSKESPSFYGWPQLLVNDLRADATTFGEQLAQLRVDRKTPTPVAHGNYLFFFDG